MHFRTFRDTDLNESYTLELERLDIYEESRAAEFVDPAAEHVWVGRPDPSRAAMPDSLSSTPMTTQPP